MKYIFRPREDITAYEIALLLKNFDFRGWGVRGQRATADVYEKVMPEDLKRHFEVNPDK